MAVRNAVAHDLSATARIAFKGFSLSPWNTFYRPHAGRYPADVENSYLLEQQEALADKSKLFTVLEVDGTGSVLRTSSSKQVVGFAIWNLAPGQRSRSQPIDVLLTTKEDRSIDVFRSELLFSTTTFAAHKWLEGYMELDNMAVDPDHMRHGYGSLLCRQGMALADADNVPIGLIAAASGKPLYDYLGFQTVMKMTLGDERPGYEAEVSFWVQRFTPEMEGSRRTRSSC